ncbi:DNA glycosylase [Nitrosopumilus sp.]|uniref:DNA glycosylase n=1 Tax=Nitrosopumilus sp. TaxID=2024843 RepID=UPI00292DBBD4|nr:DNA glycosylase [Nitrosopumilus sp.]
MQNANTINVENSINSGQVFLWKKNKEFWLGVNGQDILKIDTAGSVKSYQNTRTDFFRKKDNIEEIINSISKDSIVKIAVKQFLGLRLIRQDPFQCLISFIVSSNSNIQKIKLNLENLCKKFGRKVEFDKQEFSLFPQPEKIAQASINEIVECGLGYRSKFVKEAATKIFKDEIDLELLEKNNYLDVKEVICSIPGVGNKVADCTMLFSLNKLEAFPLDRWMVRILKKYYQDEFQIETKTITEKQYNRLHEKIVNHFGPYAGYGQQFLFKMEREINQKKWL